MPAASSLGGIFALAQDQSGFLWFGGKNGLLRFDGYRVDHYRHDAKNSHSLASNDISDLYVDSAGSLWVGMLSGGGLARYDYAAGEFVHYRHDPANPQSVASDDVYSIAEDSFGNLWLGTHGGGLNRWHRESGTFERFAQTVPDDGDSAIRSVAVDRFGNVWAASASRGLYRYNILRDEFRYYRHDPDDPFSLSDDQLQRVYVDQFDNVWVGTLGAGVNRFDRPSGRFERYQHSADQPGSLGAGRVWDIAEDANGQLWVATGSGALNRFNKWQNQFERFYPEEYAPNALAGTVIRMMVDDAGDFWLGTYNSKLNRVTDRGPHFEVMRHSPSDPNSLLSSDVTALAAGAADTLWIASDKGISHYDPNTDRFTHYPSSDPRHRLPKLPVRAMLVGPEGRLWVGTNGQGLWYLLPGENAFKEFTDSENRPLEGQKIWSLTWSLKASADGTLLVGTQSHGLLEVNTDSRTVRAYPDSGDHPSGLSNGFVWHSLKDAQGNLWVATQHGLNVRKADSNGQFDHYLPDNSPLNSAACHALLEDKQGNVWVGTTAGLTRYNRVADRFESFGAEDGLYGDSISSLLLDDMGHLWMATQRGLTRFHPQTGAVKHYDTRHGAASDTSQRNVAAVSLSSGEMFFASPSGITRINPHALRGNLLAPKIALTGLFINNQRVQIGHKALPAHINTLESLVLSHDHSTFALEFSALNFLVPQQNRYRYKLVGFDKDWKEVGAEQRSAVYSNLSPGVYSFFVTGSNNEGIWSETPRQLRIHIQPSWWRSTPAYLVYAGLSMLGLYLLFHLYQRQIRNAEKLNRRLRDLDQLKTQLLANTSEELRAPLNMIVGLSENLIEGGAGDLPDLAERQIRMIRDSGKKLSKMVDELLDYSNFRRERTQLNCRLTDVQDVVERTIVWFRPKAEEKGLELNLIIEQELPLIWADTNRVQQILFCLLENAIKFTDQGRVDTTLRCGSKCVFIVVADTGVGISAEHLQDIFRGFEHGGRGHKEGMGLGLGLARAKQLAELHGGAIEVSSKPQKGSVFTVTLPIGNPNNSDGRDAADY